jgi:hypothetical protein
MRATAIVLFIVSAVRGLGDPAAVPTTNAVIVPASPTPGASGKLTPGAVSSKPWSPPADVPAESNWDWTTTDGHHYDSVVVTKIEPYLVSITHAQGKARVPIDALPPEIQMRLNYDPDAAAVFKKEAEREKAHPYYRLTALEEAKATARQLHWPLAWICGHLEALTPTEPEPDSEDDISQMAMRVLGTQAVVIFLDGNEDLQQVPPVLLDQYFHFDDGPVPGGHHFFAPKIVFSDPDAARPLGRVTFTEMKASREKVLQDAIAAIAAGKMSTPGTP